MLKKFFVLILIISFTISPSFSKVFKSRASMMDDFTISNVQNEISFIITKDMELEEDFKIPANSIVCADIYHSREEKRWHKAGYFICKLKYYILEDEDIKNDIQEKEIYLIARKHENFDGKEAAITGSEIVLSTAVSFLLPGVDIAYFFTKGAIQRKKHNNWFKAGVSNAYENSICWLWLKGKNIELDYGDIVNIKTIDKNSAAKLKEKHMKKLEKQELKAKKKEMAKNKKTKNFNDDLEDET